MNAPVARRPHSSRDLVSAPGSTNLADLLERVLDKGVVIAGDIVLSLGAVEFLTLKVRLLIVSIEKAQELGINWWQSDPALSSRASAHAKELEQDRDLLKERLDRLERLLLAPPQEADREHAEAEQRSNAAPAFIVDKEGRVIAALKQPVQPSQEEEGLVAQERAPQPQEEERPQVQGRARQPEAAQADQPADGAPLLDPALHEHIAQAVRPVLEELRQRNAQAPQPVEQGWPEGQRAEEQEQKPKQPQAHEPEAAQAAQPADGRLLLERALHEHIAQAVRPVLEELR